jgi:phosphatidate cytidylyltransferase
MAQDTAADAGDTETAVSGSGRSRAGRNLPAAIGVGAGLGAVVLASLFGYRPSFAVLVGVAAVYGCFEMYRAIDAHSSARPVLLPVAVGSIVIIATTWLRGPNGLVLTVLLTACGVLIWRVADGAAGYLRDVGASLLILVYVPTLAAFAVLSAHADDGAARVLAFVATVVCSDTGGFVTGVLFGKHPLAPVVSKAKTWEGFAGSMIWCCACGVAFLVLCFHQPWWTGVAFGAAICATATLGDLGESMIKRDFQIKDMGALLPGHGGLMDRLDSLLPCAAVGYLLLSLFAPS